LLLDWNKLLNAAANDLKSKDSADGCGADGFFIVSDLELKIKNFRPLCQEGFCCF
jgi:hypothetical protein